MIDGVELDHSRVLISPDCRLMRGVDTTLRLHPSLLPPPTLACHRESGGDIGYHCTDITVLTLSLPAPTYLSFITFNFTSQVLKPEPEKYLSISEKTKFNQILT